jgi:integrase/recombinase XerD
VSDHKCMQRTAVGAEVPLGEMRYLKASDIDSQRVVIRIPGGKGRKDRDVMLSPKLLDALSVYWRQLRHKPTNWLFPAIDGIPQVILSPPRSLVLWTACQNAAERADLAQKHIHPHTAKPLFCHRVVILSHELWVSLFGGSRELADVRHYFARVLL